MRQTLPNPTDSNAALLPYLTHQWGSAHEWSGVWNGPKSQRNIHYMLLYPLPISEVPIYDVTILPFFSVDMLPFTMLPCYHYNSKLNVAVIMLQCYESVSCYLVITLLCTVGLFIMSTPYHVVMWPDTMLPLLMLPFDNLSSDLIPFYHLPI